MPDKKKAAEPDLSFKWNGPTSVIIELDPDDLRDVLAAANKRLELADMPDGGSCRLGGAIAEVCRGWLETAGDDRPS